MVFGVSDLRLPGSASGPPLVENFVYVSDAFCLVQFADIAYRRGRLNDKMRHHMSPSMADKSL